MHGIKAHTHDERSKMISQLIPVLEKQLAGNFVALAADGSFARNDDREFSDLELVVFVEEINNENNTILRKIIDGMLVVVIAETKDSYIRKYLDISDVWYASGAGKLMPLVNEAFINDLNNYYPTDKEEKCLKQIEKRWPFYQEITAKVLNNTKYQDSEALALSFPAMVKEVLVILAYLNSSPYLTLGAYISQAMTFSVKPKSFKSLIVLLTEGTYQDLSKTDSITRKVFEELENLVQNRDTLLYSNNIN